jgi:hypothetical protein
MDAKANDHRRMIDLDDRCDGAMRTLMLGEVAIFRILMGKPSKGGCGVAPRAADQARPAATMRRSFIARRSRIAPPQLAPGPDRS